MKRSVLLLFIFVGIVAAHGQAKKNIINYLIPDIVTEKIRNYIDSNRSDKSTFVVFSGRNDTTSILVSTYANAQIELSYLIHNTNRSITIGNKILPLIFESDLDYSDNLHVLKNKGSQNETIYTVAELISGYLITFTGTYFNPSIIRADQFQF